MSNGDLMLALHELFERVETESQTGTTGADVFERISECVELVAEERGAFIGDDL